MSERRYTNESEPSTMLSFLVQDMGPSEPTLLVKGAPATTQRKRSVLLPTAGTPHTHTHTHTVSDTGNGIVPSEFSSLLAKSGLLDCPLLTGTVAFFTTGASSPRVGVGVSHHSPSLSSAAAARLLARARFARRVPRHGRGRRASVHVDVRGATQGVRVWRKRDRLSPEGHTKRNASWLSGSDAAPAGSHRV